MKRSLPWIICALLALVCAPALALGGAADPLPVANMVVSDSGFRDADVTDPEDRTVDIVVGGRVNFSYPAGTGEYNVVWDRGSLEPATCVQTAGPVWGYGTTLPWWTQGPGWAGYCTFTAPGTYKFHSGVNPTGMQGTVVVHAEGTPTATPTVTATPTATPTTAPTTGRISAHDTASPLRNWFQDAAGADTSDSSVTIRAGGKVTFDYPAGSNFHNVEFRTASKPETCVKTTVSPTLPLPDNDQVAPMPDFAQPPGWVGECTFAAAGTYTFVCGTHPVEMTGTVIVTAAGQPTPTPTATPTSTPTATPTATPTVVPTVAPRPGIVAHDSSSPLRNWFQDAASSDVNDNSVTVAPGGTVDFSFPVGAGTTAHNVVFATAPTSCVQKTGVVIFPVAPPLPQNALPPGWSGECTFDTPGTYTFVCQTHPTEMSGSVVVGSGPEPTPVPTPTATPEPPRDIVPARVPKPWAAIDKPKTAQMTVAKFLDNKLTVESRCVSAGTGTMTMSVGNQIAAKRLRVKAKKRQSTFEISTADATCNQYGRFTVKLKPNAQARKALKGYKQSLPVTLTLRLAGPIGTTTATRTITLKGKGRG
ncbi:plastocyanin/azurin family copper-binding protein [Solirubrobacter taibaiensis]|nr:plastocyanin/azurin family copper-binding protein [Solirubrobacter taibaiensis]